MTDKTVANIYQYKDPLAFLISCFEAEKSKTQNLSIRKWAMALNVDDQDLLLIFKKKKKFSSALVSKLSLSLNLNSDEEAYFEAIVKLADAPTLKEKQVMELVLAELTKNRQPTVFVEDVSVFSHWVHMAIISMSKLEGFRCNKESISNFLCDEVSPEIVDEAVERLLRLELVHYDESGSLKKNYANTTTTNDAYRKSPHQYFEQVSELAKRGVETPAEEREYQCFSLAIKRENIPLYKNLIRDFRAKVCALAESDSADEVYQFNMQFFPLTTVQANLLNKKAEKSLGEMNI